MERRLTQAGLAEAMGFDAAYQSYVSKVEKGEINPTLESLVKFAKALECEVVDIQPLISLR